MTLIMEKLHRERAPLRQEVYSFLSNFSHVGSDLKRAIAQSWINLVRPDISDASQILGPASKQ